MASDPFEDFDDDDFDDHFDDDFEEEWDEELPGDADQFEPALRAATPLLAPAGYVYLEAGRAFDDATLRPLGLQAHRSGRAAAVHYHLLHRLPDDLPLPP